MVVKEDGTKWACQSCLKGHRVSGCTHTDRELTLVPKKGRPVTQCQHCRLERKKRSAHGKCDCGDSEKPHHSKEKCIHLREAEERAKAGFHDEHPVGSEKDAAHLAAVAEEQGCCCPHGGKCSCSSQRKDSARSNDGSTLHGPAVQKPRLETTRSDGSLTVFANGHHKPVHRRNHAAQECGMPYKMPIPRAHTDHSMTGARRSVDSLALDNGNNMQFDQLNYFSQSGSTPSMTQRQTSTSEESSPDLMAVNANNGSVMGKLSLDFTSLGTVQTNRSMDSATSDTVMFPAFDPMFPVADTSYDSWSALPSANSNMFPNNNHFGAWATNFDGGSAVQPALTAASSGTQSEIDEIPPPDDVYGIVMPSIQENTDVFDVDASAYDGGNPNRRSLPPNFFGNTDFSLPAMGNEWQTGAGDIQSSNDEKSKQPGDGQGFGDTWQMPVMQAAPGISARSNTIAPITGRPQSLSIGPGIVANEDIIKQLFPDIKLESGVFGSPRSFDSPKFKRMSGPSDTNLTSAPMDLSSLENGGDFTSRPWEDGSISVPADPFSSPFDLKQDFSNQDFPAEWNAQ